MTDDKTNSYKTLPLEEWHNNSWEGFFIELIEKIGRGSKLTYEKAHGDADRYIVFSSSGTKKTCQGGSMEYNMYVQLQFNERTKSSELQIRVATPREQAKPVREHAEHELKKIASEYGLVRPEKYGTGKTMRIFVYNKEFRQTTNDVIDIDKTVALLRKFEGLIEKIPSE